MATHPLIEALRDWHRCMVKEGHNRTETEASERALIDAFHDAVRSTPLGYRFDVDDLPHAIDAIEDRSCGCRGDE